MAEVDFDEFEDAVYAPVSDDVRRAQINRLLSYAGAASSIVLVIMLAFWGYKLAMRDVNGVPVMKALAGPMRMAPADPGGQEASNQGLSVNAIASTGIASPVADQLKLAPAATKLTADDAAGIAAVGQGATPALAADASAVLAPAALPAGAKADLAAPLEDGDTAAVETGPDPVAAAVAEAVASDPGKGLAKSLVPHARPGSHGATKAAKAAAPTEVDPATIALGTRLAQLGAFDTPDEARAKWAVLAGQYSEVMDGKALVIQQAVSGGKTFYRLRAMGFDNDEAARRFCAVLQNDNTDCTPVAQR